MSESNKINKIMQFLEKHIKRVGYIQAIKNLQYGLNIMNRGRQNFPGENFIQLDEDGDFGVKTYNCLLSLCKYASLELIFDTKNDNRINTEKIVDNINNDLNLTGEY